MGIKYSQRFCDYCDEYVLATRKKTNHILHFFLSIITGGLWILIWFLASIKVGGWKCTKCGSSVYKIFTTKTTGQDIKTVHSHDGSYNRILPISLVLIGIFAFTMALVRKEIIPFLFAGVCLGGGYLLWVGRRK